MPDEFPEKSVIWDSIEAVLSALPPQDRKEYVSRFVGPAERVAKILSYTPTAHYAAHGISIGLGLAAEKITAKNFSWFRATLYYMAIYGYAGTTVITSLLSLGSVPIMNELTALQREMEAYIIKKDKAWE